MPNAFILQDWLQYAKLLAGYIRASLWKMYHEINDALLFFLFYIFDKITDLKVARLIQRITIYSLPKFSKC